MVNDSDGMRSTIVNDLRQMLDLYNEYAKTYIMIRDKFKEGE